jgi:hypothetical protein
MQHTGQISIGYGTHLLVIATSITPTEVSLQEIETGDVQVCGGCYMNEFEVEIIPGGFNLDCTIHTNTATVAWVAE